MAWIASSESEPHMSLASNCVSQSEEHTSELQSHSDLVCRLLLEKKKTPRGICVWRARGASDERGRSGREAERSGAALRSGAITGRYVGCAKGSAERSG